MYGKNKLDCFYHVSKFEKHDEIKNTVLSLMADSEYKSPQINDCEVNITKTDWDFGTDFSRPWVEKLMPHLSSHIAETYAQVGYKHVDIFQIWFQQYLRESEHGWHIHSNNFTNVYYLEFPEGAPKTLLVNPFDQKELIELDVKEGDVVFFPSFVIHKAPKNSFEKRKTIVSYNLDVGYPDEFYGQF